MVFGKDMVGVTCGCDGGVWHGHAGHIGFGKDMGAIAALEDDQSTMTTIDYVSLVTIEIEKCMFDPLRAIKIWRAVSSHPSRSLPLTMFDEFGV
jgi:hypothetical protein